MSGKFHVRLNCRPLNNCGTAIDYHIKCNACHGAVETLTAIAGVNRDSKHDEALQIARSLEVCDICGAGAPTPSVTEADLVSAQM